MFSPADRKAILAVTGEPVLIQLSGVMVAIITAKFRRDWQEFAPYEMAVGNTSPALLVDSADMAGITSANTFVVKGTEYKMDGKPQERNDGFTLVKLGVKL